MKPLTRHRHIWRSELVAFPGTMSEPGAASEGRRECLAADCARIEVKDTPAGPWRKFPNAAEYATRPSYVRDAERAKTRAARTQKTNLDRR